MKKIIFRIIATIIFAVLTLVFSVGGLFGIIWAIELFDIPVYVFMPILAILFLWCIYKEFFGGDRMKQETRQTVFRQTKEEYEELKRDAHAHNMNVSEYIRYLVAKERKEKSNG